MMLFPRLSLPSVRIPTAISRSASASKAPTSQAEEELLPRIECTPVEKISERCSFQKYVEEESPKFKDDPRFTKGLVRYKDLKTHIKNMENGKYGCSFKSLGKKYIDDECAICLEELGHACDVITTTCNHKFHTFCLIQSLGDGICSSCPLCRNKVENIVPGGIEGASMKLVAKLRINIDQAQWCHKQVFDEIHKKAQGCLHEIRGIKAKTCFQINYGKKSKRLASRVTELKEKLDLLEHFDRVNVMGFTKICEKVGRKVSTILGETLQEKYVNEQGYYKDFAGPPEGKGLHEALRRDLDTGLGSLKRRSWTTMFFRRAHSDTAVLAPAAHRAGGLGDLSASDARGERRSVQRRQNLQIEAAGAGGRWRSTLHSHSRQEPISLGLTCYECQRKGARQGECSKQKVRVRDGVSRRKREGLKTLSFADNARSLTPAFRTNSCGS
eukprot:3260647-Rhodomonas_salina.2